VRGSDRHFCIWHDHANYLIVVKQTRTAYLLKTTYCPTPMRRQQLHLEFAEAKRRNLTF
jgi:G:T-mismatch repair DNA endonuclease (very short patch repair protein)